MAASGYGDIYDFQAPDKYDLTENEDFTGVAYLAYDAPARPDVSSSQEYNMLGEGYVSNSRIGEAECTAMNDSSSSEEDEEEEDESSADMVSEESDWSDSEEDEHTPLPQRPSDGIGPVQNSVWNARYFPHHTMPREPGLWNRYPQLPAAS